MVCFSALSDLSISDDDQHMGHEESLDCAGIVDGEEQNIRNLFNTLPNIGCDEM